MSDYSVYAATVHQVTGLQEEAAKLNAEIARLRLELRNIKIECAALSISAETNSVRARMAALEHRCELFLAGTWQPEAVPRTDSEMTDIGLSYAEVDQIVRGFPEE